MAFSLMINALAEDLGSSERTERPVVDFFPVPDTRLVRILEIKF